MRVSTFAISAHCHPRNAHIPLLVVCIVLPGFELAESIWSQDSDLTLDDLALESDSVSSQTRSTASSTRWSAAPPTPSTSRHLRLTPPLEPVSAPAPEPAIQPAPTPVPTPLRVETPVQAPASKEPESPAPAYSRDPLEFDPALLASLDPQLRFHPFEAFEDLCWACCADVPHPFARTRRSRLPNASSSQPPLSTQLVSLTVHSSLSDTSTTTVLPRDNPTPPVPSLAYAETKPLPDIPPPSPLPSVKRTQRERGAPPYLPVVVTSESFTLLGDASLPPAPNDTVHFFPVRAPSHSRSKSTGRRLTTAIARLRGRE
jgi:hypothetical protein